MRALSLAIAVSLASLGPVTATAAEPPAAASQEPAARIAGVVKDRTTGAPIEHARVVVECECLDASLEAWTDQRGIYRVVEPLPAGAYTVRVLAENANVAKRFRLPPEGKMRANVLIDPRDPEPLLIVHRSLPDTPPREFTGLRVAPRLPTFGYACVLRSSGCECGRSLPAAFELQRSLFDGGGMHWFTGGPRVIRSLL